MFRCYIWKKEGLFEMEVSPQNSFNLSKNLFVKDHGDSFSQLLKRKDLISIKIFFYFIDVYHNYTTN